MLNSLNFCLSGKLLISPSNFKDSLAGYDILSCRVFLFITLNISSHSLLTYRVSTSLKTYQLRNQLIRNQLSLRGVPLYVISCCSLAAFNVLFLSLIFVRLIIMCLGIFLLGFILPGALCASWTWLIISFPMVGTFSVIISSNIVSGPFSLSTPSVTLIM